MSADWKMGSNIASMDIDTLKKVLLKQKENSGNAWNYYWKESENLINQLKDRVLSEGSIFKR